jgi:putative ABC transport system permease protein
MITKWLRRATLASVRLLPSTHRARAGADLPDTIRALAADARTSGGPAAERAYLMRELADLVRQAWLLRRARRPPLSGSAGRMIDGFRDDVRASLRQWRRRPMATAGVIGTLAVAVAAVVTTFGLVTAVLWRRLPFPDPASLVFVWETASDERGAFRVTSGRFFGWQQEARGFSSMALFGAAGFALDANDGSVPVRGVRVSASYFDVLGVRPLFGRTFDSGDEVPGAPRVVLLSAAMWRGRFGARRDIIGLNLRLGGEPFTVVGVMPDLVTPGWPSNPARVAAEPELREFWVPIVRTPALEANTGAHVFGVVARLKSGVTVLQGDAELAALRPGDVDRHHGMTTPFREQFVRDVRAPLLVLFAASLAVLIVAAANLAALQVSRFEQRRGELSTRAALGAGRMRLAGLLLIDAILLSVGGGTAGLWLSSMALPWIPTQLPASMPFVTAPVLDLPAALFACSAALAITGALSMWPTLRLRTLSSAPRGAVAPARTRVYRGLVAAQVAAGVALAVPAALLGESLVSLRAREPGFIVDNVLVVDVSVSDRGAVPLGRAMRFEDSVTEAVAATPGVAGAAFAYDHPLEANWTEIIKIRGDVATDPLSDLDAQLRIVSPAYFDALGVRVLDGRAFEPREDTTSPGAVVVNEAFAVAHGGRVLGRRLQSGAAVYAWGPAVPAEYEIVGVVENERFRGLDLPSAPAVYLSTRQFPQSAATLLVRTAGGMPDPAPRLREIVRGVAPGATIGHVRALSDILSEQLASRRLTSRVTGVFAIASVGLALLGLYGLLAVIVAGRSRVVGVRLALGASPGAIARKIVVESVAAAGIGVGAGVVLALATGRFLERLLVDVSARDPWTVLTVSALVLAGAVLAAAGPARRAARTDPVVALRADG